MMGDNKADQVKNAICNDNANLILFSNQVNDILSKCDLSGVNCNGNSSGRHSLQF